MSLLDNAGTNPVVMSYFRLLATLGKPLINSQFPNDFEYYMCCFELVDSDFNVVDFLIFPIMPNAIEEDENNILSIKKTFGGVVTLGTTTFLPRTINLSGNFGRRFKILIGRAGIDAAAVQFTGIKSFSSQVKTGYGVTKVLENILTQSNKLDKKGNPYKLFFYNLAFGTSYLVKINNKKFRQNFPDSNMIWNYNINMTAVSPLSGLRSAKDQKRALAKLLLKDSLMKAIKGGSRLIKNELSRKDITIASASNKR